MVKKKVLRSKLRQKSLGLNLYAHMLLDPEHAHSIGVPDEYPFKTHKAKIAMSRTANFDSNGNAYCTIGRSLREFFGQYGTTNVSANRFWELSTGGSAYTPERDWVDQENLPLPQDSNVAFPPHFYNNSDPAALSNFIGGDLENGVYAGTMAQCAPSDTLDILGYTGDTTANAFKLWANFFVGGAVDPIVKVESTTLTGNGSSISATLTAPALADGIVDWGFERVAGSGLVTACAGTLTRIGTSENHVVYEPIGKEDGTEYNTLKDLGTRARIVAMSLWAQYSGAMTSNGRIACGQISHQDLTRLPDTNIGTLSILPGFYSDSLLKPDEAGGYAWFRPLSAEDIKFDNLDHPDEVGSRLMCAIHANDADAQNITFRCVAVVEVQTTNQVVNPTGNLVAPPMIWEAQRELRDFNSGMGNTNHLKVIAAKLKEMATSAAHKIATLGPAALSVLNFLKDHGADIPEEIEMGAQKAIQYAPMVANFAESVL